MTTAMHDSERKATRQASSEKKERTAVLSIAASVVITIGKGVAGFATGSLALISDAAHSLLDVAATTVTWLAIRVANKPADDEHQYGHGKFESLAALVETAFLFVLSGAVAFEGIRRLSTGQADVEPSLFAAAVLVAAIAIDAWRWWTLKRVARETRSEALEADALHFSSDLVNSVLVLAALGAAAYGYQQADALVAIGVSAFIAIAGFRLARRTIDALLDTAPKGVSDKVRAIVESVPGVVSVGDVRVRSGGAQMFADIAVGVSRTLPLDRVTAIKQRIAEAARVAWPDAILTVTTEPLAMDNETILERVMLIAAKRRIPVHHVTVQQIGERLSVSMDLEMDGRMSLGAAHAIASKFEAAIREELGPQVEVETHIEPLEVARLEGHDADAAVTAHVVGSLMSRAAETAIVRDVHSVRVRATPAGLVVNYHCRVDPGLDVATVHENVDALERAVRADHPTINRVVGHTEPRR